MSSATKQIDHTQRITPAEVPQREPARPTAVGTSPRQPATTRLCTRRREETTGFLARHDDTSLHLPRRDRGSPPAASRPRTTTNQHQDSAQPAAAFSGHIRASRHVHSVPPQVALSDSCARSRVTALRSSTNPSQRERRKCSHRHSQPQAVQVGGSTARHRTWDLPTAAARTGMSDCT
jgi:hypothetical protein